MFFPTLFVFSFILSLSKFDLTSLEDVNVCFGTMRCALKGCNSRSYNKSTAQLKYEEEKGTSISFFQFPSGDRGHKWAEVIGGEPNGHICSLHFEEHCIEGTPTKKRLKEDAVPSIFGNNQKSKKRKLESKDDSGPSKQLKEDDNQDQSLILQQGLLQKPQNLEIKTLKRKLEYQDEQDYSHETYCSSQEGNIFEQSLLEEPQDLRMDKLHLLSPMTCFPHRSTRKPFPSIDSYTAVLTSPRACIYDTLNFKGNSVCPVEEPLDLSKDAITSLPLRDLQNSSRDKCMKINILTSSKASLSDVYPQLEPLDLSSKPLPLPRVKISLKPIPRFSSVTPINKTEMLVSSTLQPSKTAECTAIPICVTPPSRNTAGNSKTLDDFDTTPERRRYLEEKYPRKKRQQIQETPRKRKLRLTLKKKCRQVRALQQAARRKNKKVSLLQRVIKVLEDNEMMGAEDLQTLKSMGGPHKELLERQLYAVRQSKKKSEQGPALCKSKKKKRKLPAPDKFLQQLSAKVNLEKNKGQVPAEQNSEKNKQQLSADQNSGKNKEQLSVEKNSEKNEEQLSAAQKSKKNKRQSSAKRKLKKKKSFGGELRKFALTLHYKSPAAYAYVRTVFKLALPHPKTIYRWYKVIDGRPGFTTESFVALKEKCKESDGIIYGALIIDEMSIRKLIETDGKRYYGFVDMGGGTDTDNAEEAKDCLVIMLVGINSSWKVPLGYFFTNGVTGAQKANLILQSLRLLGEIEKVLVKSVTSDGTSSNQTMFSQLGCKFDDVENLQPWFINPVNGQKVYMILDNCHMAKLVRNTLGEKGVIYSPNDELIKWLHIKLLHQLQETEGLHLGNKLTSKHINFKRNIMKVALATQVLSTSAADSLQLLMDLHIESFEDCRALIEFLRRFDTLIDILNSKNMMQGGFKKPLHNGNIDQTKDVLDQSVKYIKQLKSDNKGTPMTSSARKTGFLGFLINIASVLSLFEELVTNGPLKFLPTYKLCQDHLEMFFGILRSMGGFNNNPTVRQLISAYKKLLVQMELQSSRNGNCIPLENISILTCSSRTPEKVINTNTGCGLLGEKSSTGFSKDSNLSEEDLHLMFKIDDPEVDHFYSFNPTELTLIQKNIVNHIGGFIVRRLAEVLKCSVCILSLLEPAVKGRAKKSCKLIAIKDRGGLFYPSTDVSYVVEQCEKMVRLAYGKTQSFTMQPKYTPLKLTNDVMKLIHGSGHYSQLFQTLNQHAEDQEVLLDHKYHLVKAICQRFITLRIHHICTRAIEPANSKRQIFNKLLLFGGF